MLVYDNRHSLNTVQDYATIPGFNIMTLIIQIKYLIADIYSFSW
jgi:hypothetical protein